MPPAADPAHAPALRDAAPVPEGLRPLMAALCAVGRDLAHLIRRGALGSGHGATLGAEAGTNSDGDTQKALDVIADDAFAAALGGTGVRWYASEERAGVSEIDLDGTLALAIDPLDGSSNIDVNVSIGTIFSIRQAQAEAEASFLRPGHEQMGAGYIIYGPQTMLVASFGQGTRAWLLDPECGQFVLVGAPLHVPETTREFAINASNAPHWAAPVQAYIRGCLAEAPGHVEGAFNMRWVASLVAETHRILTRGGVFLYPGDARPGYGQGRLRMVYECAPIAMIVEQAGGLATDMRARLLDLAPAALHARTPLAFGARTELGKIAAAHDEPGQAQGEAQAALFASRGLFRNEAFRG